MSRKMFTMSLALALTAGGVLGSEKTRSGKDVEQLEKQAVELDNEARQGPGNQAVFDRLSEQLKVPAADLRAQQEQTKFGFGQLFIANSLSQTTGKPFDQIAQEFQSGKGWGEIAKENNVKLGQVVSDLKRANKQMKEHPQGQSATAGRGSRGERGSSQRGAPGRRGSGGMGRPHGKGPGR